MASRPFQFLEKKRSKIRKRAAKHFEGLAALSTHSAGRRSRPGVNPFISALTVARCPATFPGVWPQLWDTLSTSRSIGQKMGDFMYAQSAVFLPLLMPLPSPAATVFSRQRRQSVSHTTLCFAKSCAKWGRCPLWKPPQEKVVRYPSTGHIPPFLVLKHGSPLYCGILFSILKANISNEWYAKDTSKKSVPL